MPEQQERKYINVPVDEDEYDQISQEAEDHGAGGRAPLLRLLVERVREFGGGNLADGLARLRMAQKEGLHFAEDSDSEE